MPDIKQAKVVILATHGFEQSELQVPLQKLREAGAQVVVAYPEKGQIRGWKEQDWGESEIDCGFACTKCLLGQNCNMNADCASGACDGLSHLCVPDACTDHHVDYAETDTDCGGPVCAPCTVGKKCLVSSDCQAGLACVGIPLTCN